MLRQFTYRLCTERKKYRICIVVLYLKRWMRCNKQITRAIKKELCMMKDLTHDNVNRFVGVCLDQPHVCIVSSYCSRGSLKVTVSSVTLSEINHNNKLETYIHTVIIYVANDLCVVLFHLEWHWTLYIVP